MKDDPEPSLVAATVTNISRHSAKSKMNVRTIRAIYMGKFFLDMPRPTSTKSGYIIAEAKCTRSDEGYYLSVISSTGASAMKVNPLKSLKDCQKELLILLPQLSNVGRVVHIES